ncbi:MAG: sigma 54-interacting transcriptional regulator [Firmicutes bacterium]|nr:sigma 54-interacting transcriptional regulator [Bacillota bacterium]MBQ6810378.1 sigma 54-interacting transcriptional regulator [Bacillota bacterium]
MHEQITKELLMEIIEHFYAAIYITDAHGNMIFRNKAALRMDRDEEDLGKNKELSTIYSGTEFSDGLNSPCLDALKTGMPHIQENLEWYLQDGTRVNAITSAYPYHDENGEIKGVYALAEDIDKLRKYLIKQGAFHRKKSYRMRNKLLQNGTQYIFNDIIGESELIKNAIIIARRFAAKKLPVMIYGETGTGKEMFAQSIHNASPYVSGPFVPINCAAIPETLLESILFGTVKGAFTGATDTPGLFEKAEGGSVFLDEINSMPMLLQAKILRALQEKEVQRIGDSKIRKINCRIISATNKLPSDAIRDGELREDLYYRLSTGMVWIPSLHERTEDIDLLVDYFIEKSNEEMDTCIIAASEDLKKLFHSYFWPGNIRELSNAVESAVNMTTDGESILEIRHLPTYIKRHFGEELSANPNAEDIFLLRNDQNTAEPSYITMTGDINTMVDNYEKEILLFAISEAKGNISRCAAKLGISRQSLWVKFKKYNIDPKAYKLNKANF